MILIVHHVSILGRHLFSIRSLTLRESRSVIPAGHEHIPLQIEAFITRVWCLTNHNLNPWSHMNLYFNNSLRNQSQESICINTSLSTDANLRSKYEIGTNVTSYDVHLELKCIRKNCDELHSQWPLEARDGAIRLPGSLWCGWCLMKVDVNVRCMCTRCEQTTKKKEDAHTHIYHGQHKRVNYIYKTQTTYITLTPMQKPHLRAGWMFMSLSMLGLSSPASKLLTDEALGTAVSWRGTAALKDITTPMMARRRIGRKERAMVQLCMICKRRFSAVSTWIFMTFWICFMFSFVEQPYLSSKQHRLIAGIYQLLSMDSSSSFPNLNWTWIFLRRNLVSRETGTQTNFNHQFWPIDALIISFFIFNDSKVRGDAHECCIALFHSTIANPSSWPTWIE